MKLRNTALRQGVPVLLTAFVAAGLIGVLWLLIIFLNKFSAEPIGLALRPADILVGAVIYLKTSVDFAIFIARLMESNVGVKRRIAIELGTAAGNAAGTFLVLIIWSFFREVRPLLALMILLAALVLFRLAEEGLDHAHGAGYPAWFAGFVRIFKGTLSKINRAIAPVLRFVIPRTNAASRGPLGFVPLFWFSCSIPFILGLDDFAGYVPVFSVINVFGFAAGVILGHMILNMVLFISPARTVKVVKNPIVALVGSVAFIILAIWGIVEVVHLLY